VAIKRLALDGGRFPLEPDRISVVRAQANAANGMTLGLDGRLVVCEQGSPAEHARIARVDRASGLNTTPPAATRRGTSCVTTPRGWR
jgi:hypothetical protein